MNNSIWMEWNGFISYLCVDAFFFHRLAFNIHSRKREHARNFSIALYNERIYGVYDLQIMCRIHCSTDLKLWYSLRPATFRHIECRESTDDWKLEWSDSESELAAARNQSTYSNRFHVFREVNMSRNSPVELCRICQFYNKKFTPIHFNAIDPKWKKN